MANPVQQILSDASGITGTTQFIVNTLVGNLPQELPVQAVLNTSAGRGAYALDERAAWYANVQALGVSLSSSYYYTIQEIIQAGLDAGFTPKAIVSGKMLFDADWLVKATNYNSSTTALTDLSGNGNHAVFGSGTNSPTYLPYKGTKYVYFAGTFGEDFRTPDSAALDITGDFIIICRIEADITPASSAHIVSKYDNSTVGSYYLRINTDGSLLAGFVTTTPTNKSATSTATLGSVGLSDNQKIWVGCVLDADNGASGYTMRFYYSATDTNDYTQVVWSQLGADVTAAGAVTIQNSAEPLQVGARKVSNPASNFNGNVYWAGVFNNLLPSSSSLVAEFNPNTATIASNHTTITNGTTVWTRTTAATGKHIAIVDESKVLFGVDDYAQVAAVDTTTLDFDATQDFTIVAAVRHHDFSDGALYVSKSAATPVNDAWTVATFGTPIATTYEAGVQGALVTSASPADGARHVITYRRIAGSEASLWLNTTEGTPTSTLVSQDTTGNANKVTLGATSDLAVFADEEFMGAAIFRRALSDAEIAQVVSELAL